MKTLLQNSIELFTMPKPKPVEYDYEGMTMADPIFSRRNLDKVKATTFDDNDILIATYAKCGTTWMQEIVYQVFHEGDFEGSDKVPLYERYNFLESITKKNESEIDLCLAKPPPRLLKTHLPAKFFESTLKEKKTKIIVVYRNPKDMLASYYNFYKMTGFDFDGTWNTFFEKFKKDKIVHGNYFDMQLSWWAYRNDPRVIIFKYEEMLKDPEKVVQQVAAHLNKNISDDLVRKIAERTSFKSMKANPMLNYSTFASMDHKTSPFMRKGQVGDWKNYFSEEQRKYVDEVSRRKFEPEGLFLEDE